MVISLLSAWWASIGLPTKKKRIVWASLAVMGLLLSHIGLHKVLYRPQAKRMNFMLSMAPFYLGGYAQAKPAAQQAIRDHAEALLKATDTIKPIWVFPMEMRRARRTLRRIATEF
jgi:hypothetical protein